MDKVILQLAMTVDGYIARENGDVDFLNKMHGNTQDHFNKFLARVDTIIMGSGSYEKMLSFGAYPFSNKKTYVMTTRDFEAAENIEFTSEDIKEVLSNVDGNVWLFGGSKIVQSFIKEDLIDEYIIAIVPELIGKGMRLFKEFDEDRHLVLNEVTKYDDLVMLHYCKEK